MSRGSLIETQLHMLPGRSYRSPPVVAPPEPLPEKLKPTETPEVSPSKDTPRSLQEICREEIENLHGIFVCWFKGLQPSEDLEKELEDRITPNFSHIAPNGQFLKGRANLLQNLLEKYNAYPTKAFDIQIENVKIVWTLDDLCLVTYEEWQWWRDVDSGFAGSASGSPPTPNTTSNTPAKEEDVVRFGRLSSCLLKQRPGNFQWIHVHETWLEGVGPTDVLNIYDDMSESTGSSYKVAESKKKKKDKGEERRRKEEEESHQGAIKTELTKAKHPPMVQLTPVPTQVQAASNASRRRHISPQLTDYAKACMVNNELIGISIHGWDIGTGQGPMGDEGWFSAASTNFENVSQYRGSHGKKMKRRIALPEMVFPAAHVAFEHRRDNLWISWDVLDALDDWAKAHHRIPVNSDKVHNGVSVLKSEDAALWADKKKNILADDGKSKEAFHFDWTYSTPFCGSVEGGYWEPLPESGLKLDMLKDKSVPILFFDELVLYEDDLHDNGQVQFSLKIRVMPTCGFVLARLWVRIDRVLLRLRETRVMFEFGKDQNETTKIYRDVTWRECQWQDLAANDLPTNLKVWCSDGHETPQLAMLMSKLPEVDLPKGMLKHAVLKRGKSPKK